MTTQNRFSPLPLAAIVLVAAAGAVSQSALADESRTTLQMQTSTHTVTVRYDDLDLRRDPGREALHARLTRAANQVCGSFDIRRTAEYRHVQECREQALANAMANVSDRQFVQWAQARADNEHRAN
jgi:UrcA family protein